jgi:hypothetical protein
MSICGLLAIMALFPSEPDDDVAIAFDLMRSACGFDIRGMLNATVAPVGSDPGRHRGSARDRRRRPERRRLRRRFLRQSRVARRQRAKEYAGRCQSAQISFHLPVPPQNPRARAETLASITASWRTGSAASPRSVGFLARKGSLTGLHCESQTGKRSLCGRRARPSWSSLAVRS